MTDAPIDGPRVASSYGLRQKLGLGVGLALFGVMMLLPPPADLGVPAWRTAALTLLMAIWWLSEAVPLPVTSLLPILLLPPLGVAKIDDAAGPYAHPLIFLFMGGFMIALAMQRWHLHRRIALRMIARIGTAPARIVAGLLVAAAFLSMWVSNTATTLMMLPIGLSVIELIDSGQGEGAAGGDQDRRNFAAALLLAITFGASIGGMATLIGTPPNAFVAGFMAKSYGMTVGFLEWMAIGLPTALVLLPVTWLILVKVACPFRIESGAGAKSIARALAALGPMSRGERRVAAVFALTALAWIGQPLLAKAVPALNLTDTGIAMAGALILFLIPVDFGRGQFVLDWHAVKELPWGVLILFGGGLSLADQIKASGLADWIGSAAGGLDVLPLIAIVVVVGVIVVLLSELASNTATAATFLPIVASIALGLGENPWLLVVPATLAASCGFMLPVATPPNAIVFGTGRITVGQMARAGMWLDIAGVIVIATVAYGLTMVMF